MLFCVLRWIDAHAIWIYMYVRAIHDSVSSYSFLCNDRDEKYMYDAITLL